MIELQFEWNEAKTSTNLKKHGISFEEAKTVFGDPLAITISDPNYLDREERYIDIGLSSQGRILVVAYTERQSKIRIISCRRATAREQRIYEQHES